MTSQTGTPNVDEMVAAIEEANEIWGIVGRGGICFRYGPFTKDEVGPLMEQAISEGVGMMFAINAGRDIDWDAMREIAPVDYNLTEAKDAETEE